MSGGWYSFHYWIVILLMMSGLYVVISSSNMLKKIAGLLIFQTSVFLLFIAMGKVQGGSIPVVKEGVTLYSNPLPQVIILTAIVVAVATMALGLALVLRINGAYGTIDEEAIQEMDGNASGNASDPDVTQSQAHKDKKER